MGTSKPTLSSPPPFSSPSSYSAASRSSIVEQKQIFLQDWWLEKAHPASDGRRLGIGGCPERPGKRIFHSSAVLKRHDTVTLETADGILVKICGAINKSLTHDNGFPSEICRRFLYGFPYDWEEFASQSFAEESTGTVIPEGLSNLGGNGVSFIDGSKRISPKSFDDLPFAALRDCSDSSVEYSVACALWKSMFKDILQKHGGSAEDHDMMRNSAGEESPSKQENSAVKQNKKGKADISIRKGRTAKYQVMAESSSIEISREHEKRMVEHKNKGEHDMPEQRGRRQKLQNVTLDKGTFERKGPCTRSTTRFKNSRSKHEESVLVSHAENALSNADEMTKKLKLRNRSVKVHVKRIP